MLLSLYIYIYLSQRNYCLSSLLTNDVCEMFDYCEKLLIWCRRTRLHSPQLWLPVF
uniref:Uncharacterized protein n=1 Tax=Helianthus annuus TaxID=4232 RepID=A0A251VB02_HELAN